MNDEPHYDVVAVEIATGKVEIMASDKTERNAEAIINMAVMRRGVETHFYKRVLAGSQS